MTATPAVNTAPVGKADPPTSILKPGAIPVVTQANTSQVIQEIEAPPPPERGSSYAIMSLRVKESTKRVSFDTSGHNVNQEIVHEDPNVRIEFIFSVHNASNCNYCSFSV